MANYKDNMPRTAEPFNMVYFHGFASSGATGTAELLRKIFPSSEILAPDIPVDPAEALPYLKAFCEEHHPDVVVGTSMGGMYAQQMRGFLRICVNPAFRMSTMSIHNTILKSQKTNKRSMRLFPIPPPNHPQLNETAQQHHHHPPPEGGQILLRVGGEGAPGKKPNTPNKYIQKNFLPQPSRSRHPPTPRPPFLPSSSSSSSPLSLR